MGTLTAKERKKLEQCEATIARGLAQFMEVGCALASIREGRLYIQTHATFADYCADVWELGRPRAYQLISAAEVAVELSTNVDTPPLREAHVRPLLNVPADHRGQVWQDALRSAPARPDGVPRITARCVEQAVERWNQGRLQDADGRGQRTDDKRTAPDVIDVESSPVVTVDQPGQEHDITCPNCGHHEADADGDCTHCLEPMVVGEPAAVAGDTQDSVAGADAAEPRAPERVDPALEAWGRVEQLARLWAAEYGGLAVAAARLENLAARLRAEM